MNNQIKKNSSFNKYLPLNFSHFILFFKLKIKIAISIADKLMLEWLWRCCTVNNLTLNPFRVELFSVNRPIVYQNYKKPDGKGSKSYKTYLFDTFLHNQFILCVNTFIPLNHLIPITLFTCIFSWYRYIIFYWFFIIFILLTIYLSEKLPNLFGKRYIRFLKDHSSKEAFHRYCGDSFCVIKMSMANPKWLRIVFIRCVSKGISVTFIALALEHYLHHMNLIQIYEYKIDEILNKGVHSSGEPYSPKLNSPSLVKNLLFGSSKK